MMADSSEDEFDNITTDRHVNHTEGRSDGARSSSSVPSILIFVFCCLFYLYVLICLFLNLVVPTSISPFLGHPFVSSNDNQTAANSENEALHVGIILLRNGGLLLLFLIQHSFYPRNLVKQGLAAANMPAFARAVYVFTTCITLQVINYLWAPISPKYHLWNCTYDTTFFYFILTAVHLLCWASIGFSLFAFDYLELFGIKQLYYSYHGVSTDPMSFKSWDNYDLLCHMRHPVFLAPLFLLWGVPLMTYNRFLVSTMVPAYLLWGNKITDEDKFYVEDMFNKKTRFLLHGKTD